MNSLYYQDRIKELLAPQLFSLKWRHHGLGCLQAYIKEGETEETRVHIWHPKLCLFPAGSSPGRPHNHRFDLTSTVLAGQLVHDIWELQPDPDGDWVEYEVVNARNQRGDNTDVSSPSEATYKVTRRQRLMTTGATYRFAKGEYHQTIVQGLAVTLMTKSNQSGRAKILGPRDGVQHAFSGSGNLREFKQMAPLIQLAVDALCKPPSIATLQGNAGVSGAGGKRGE